MKELYELLSTPVVFVAIIGVLGNWLISQLNKRREIIQKEQQFFLENLKSFWEKQNELYSEALKVASFLVLSKEDINSDNFINNYKRFWELYWSELPTCESKEVETAMVIMGELIHRKKDSDQKLTKGELKMGLLNLSTAIRNSSILLEYSETLKRKIRKKSF